MSRIIQYFYCVLFLPLVIGISPAVANPLQNCIHCKKVQVSQPDCCVAMNHGFQEQEIGLSSQKKSSCPHEGLCQREVDLSVATLPLFSQQEASVAVPDVETGFKQYLRSASLPETGFSFPHHKRAQLFIFFCSFLI